MPDQIPEVQGLDMAGKSIFCDQTGGDYYDFIDAVVEGEQVIVTAVGDVSGHGIPSALLMASARAFLRQRLAVPGSMEEIINDVNAQFCRDVGQSGRFMTLFLSVIHLKKQRLSWVRAGHDPALLYDPNTDRFMELRQKGGIPLGVDDTFDYKKCVHLDQRFESGQILFMGTDGIWESANSGGKMFGKERIKKVIRTCNTLNADQIMDALLVELNAFLDTADATDDVTMLIIKNEK